MKKKYHLFVSGRVQGVFFRASAKEKADELDIAGWAKNLSDGRVEIVIEGDEKLVDEMLKWCYKGSSNSKIEKVEKIEEKIEGLGEFRI